jgi:hypothetical protein
VNCMFSKMAYRMLIEGYLEGVFLEDVKEPRR